MDLEVWERDTWSKRARRFQMSWKILVGSFSRVKVGELDDVSVMALMPDIWLCLRWHVG